LAGKIPDADGFAFVTGEYKRGVQPGLKNLTDHFLEEWFWRPAAIASYSAGRISGARAAIVWHGTVSEMGVVVVSGTIAVGPIALAPLSRLICIVRWQFDAEAGSAECRVVFHSNPTPMCFNNRTGDGQPHSHSGLFRREEAVKKVRKSSGSDSRAAIFDSAAHRLRGQQRGSNMDVAATSVCHGLHRVDG
jgi:hypothetical protein